MKKYKFQLDIKALILVLVIMIPNFIWFAIPAPNDLLRAESVTGTIDTITSIVQVILITTLCLIVNIESKKFKISFFIIVMAINCLLYFSAWVFYYLGIANTLVILTMCIAPCLAFLFYALDRKNKIAVLPISIFTILHFIYAVVNF